MKITNEHKEKVSLYLNGLLRYRETYDELYDHILSSMEQQPEGSPFWETLNAYVQTEFGGESGLHKTERSYRRQLFHTMKRRYFGYIAEQFKLPAICFWIFSVIATYTILNAAWFNEGWFFTFFMALALIPPIINSIRYLKTGYVFKSTKPSIADEVFRWVKYFPGFVIVAFMLYQQVIMGSNLTLTFNGISPLSATIISLAYLLHSASVFNLYREEFRLRIAN